MDVFVILLYVGAAILTIGLVALGVVGLRHKPVFCPYCTMPVHAEATVCRHCHKDL